MKLKKLKRRLRELEGRLWRLEHPESAAVAAMKREMLRGLGDTITFRRPPPYSTTRVADMLYGGDLTKPFDGPPIKPGAADPPVKEG